MYLEKLGEPIKIGEYMYKYEEMIRYILKELTFIDFQSTKTQSLLKAELRKAENSFYIFYEQNRREPDYAFLQKMVTDFGINRIQFFQPEISVLSADNFAYRHIEMLKLDRLLTGLVFNQQDLIFLEKYERNRAVKYFEDSDVYLPGYEEERISINQLSQQMGYQRLKEEFLSDPFIDSFRKNKGGI